MLPKSPLNNFGDGDGRHVELSRQRGVLLGFGTLSDFNNVIDTQLRPSIRFALMVAVSAFLMTISVIATFGSLKGVCRIAANGVIASVENEFSRKNILDAQRKTDDMGQEVLVVEADLPITSLVPHCSTPVPTVIGAFDIDQTPKLPTNRIRNIGPLQTFRFHAVRVFNVTFQGNYEYA